MAELEDKLGAILNNPQAMSQIMSLAQSLNGGGQGQPPPAVPSALPESRVIPEEASPPEPGQEPQPDPAALLGGELDPRLMEAGMRALAAYRDPDNRQAALLQALRPFVKPQRYAKVDKAIQIARLSKVIRAALDTFKGGAD